MSFPSWNRTPRIIFTARYDLQSVIIIYTYFFKYQFVFNCWSFIWSKRLNLDCCPVEQKNQTKKTTFTLTDGDLIDANNSDELDLLDYMH